MLAQGPPRSERGLIGNAQGGETKGLSQPLGGAEDSRVQRHKIVGIDVVEPSTSLLKGLKLHAARGRERLTNSWLQEKAAAPTREVAVELNLAHGKAWHYSGREEWPTFDDEGQAASERR